ncbi:MAG: DoxX family protein [Acidobacteriaceae bacterium]|nr:DoxX family protein [Acidobacteriaceae bacterium]MBV8572340.1 DoxX family protein [Acidobacteriaceae bacterium]
MPKVNAALLLIRIAAAAAFIYHGSAILFGAFGGPGPQKFAAFIHVPVVLGYLVGLGQFLGGLALLFGIFTRIAAAVLAVIMLGAIFLVHLPHGFDIGKGGSEYAFAQLCISLALLLAGPGVYSIASRLSSPIGKL